FPRTNPRTNPRANRRANSRANSRDFFRAFSKPPSRVPWALPRQSSPDGLGVGVTQWTVPPQPPPPGGWRPPIRAGKVFLGIGLAILGHLVIVGATVLAVYATKEANSPLIISLF